jgi:hypothetical protein
VCGPSHINLTLDEARQKAQRMAQEAMRPLSKARQEYGQASNEHERVVKHARTILIDTADPTIARDIRQAKPTSREVAEGRRAEAGRGKYSARTREVLTDRVQSKAERVAALGEQQLDAVRGMNWGE